MIKKPSGSQRDCAGNRGPDGCLVGRDCCGNGWFRGGMIVIGALNLQPARLHFAPQVVGILRVAPLLARVGPRSSQCGRPMAWSPARAARFHRSFPPSGNDGRRNRSLLAAGFGKLGGHLHNRSTPIAETSLRGLHPRSIDEPRQIAQLLERARENRCVFHRGLNTQVNLETAQLETIAADCLIFDAPNFEQDFRDRIFFNFSIQGRPYFLSTTRARPFENRRLAVRIPRTIFYSERRDRMRRAPGRSKGDPRLLTVSSENSNPSKGIVVDLSPGGLGLIIQQELPPIRAHC